MGSMQKVKTGLGYQNYEEVIANNIFYVDKTRFIREWWENADKVTLITRPRRFGKTLNMSTVECFFPINMLAEVICLKAGRYGRKSNTDSFRAHFR